MRLKGSEVAVADCVDDADVGRVGGVRPKLKGAKGGPWVFKVCAGVRETGGSGVVAPVSDLLTAAISSTA